MMILGSLKEWQSESEAPLETTSFAKSCLTDSGELYEWERCSIAFKLHTQNYFGRNLLRMFSSPTNALYAAQYKSQVCLLER